MVCVSNRFQMRNINLSNFPINSSSNRLNNRTVMNRARIGMTTGTAKSLNILRQALQTRINDEIHVIIQKYLEKYFQPAVENIKQNYGANAISDQHLQAVCREVLEEAKSMYSGHHLSVARSNSPTNTATTAEGSDHLSDSENICSLPVQKRRHRRDSDSNSESGSFNTNTLLKPSPPLKKKRLKTSPGRGRLTPVKMQVKPTNEPVKREGPQWDSSRLTPETRFVLGSKANKALGFGATRGRLYTKHPTLFRYIGDQEDKQWLHERKLMPLAGGRAYLLIKEDIESLLQSDEYKNAPGVNASDMGEGFTVPESMIVKMRGIMDAMRNGEGPRKQAEAINRAKAAYISSLSAPANDSSSIGSNSNQPSLDTMRLESRGVSPADDLDYVNSTGMPSTNPSPFSISGIGLSPNEDNQVSPIASDISCATLGEIQL
ncbi:Deoxynucleotidyltransferase terminal-interacting protein 1-like protein [Dinothrombium tinctorium]|uniref:Deoxynucleotidyltransferase terminal-interacting protein 1-like protein n=1 Tax=Dinothrombium tinctorium TaxID=1965070 RepID=A0A3S3RSX0_9ACAR|nr:Deoxynucleotidyltransferase terminal-interacting protein 1-like protein [Dinothrombium tinctorium]RWS04240.1 Deoxynucleotidyltransferase terminal-interacting protein 1-like protein [Dinothrombium tinctorium]